MPDDDVLNNFGDVFTYSNQDFVYLGESVERKIIYAARILDDTQSRQLNAANERLQYKPSYNADSLVFSFVVLSTDTFKDRLAWFRDTGKDGTKLTKPYCSLEPADLEKIKEEILTGPFPADLQDIVRNTTA